MPLETIVPRPDPQFLYEFSYPYVANTLSDDAAIAPSVFDYARGFPANLAFRTTNTVGSGSRFTQDEIGGVQGLRMITGVPPTGGGYGAQFEGAKVRMPLIAPFPVPQVIRVVRERIILRSTTGIAPAGQAISGWWWKLLVGTRINTVTPGFGFNISPAGNWMWAIRDAASAVVETVEFVGVAHTAWHALEIEMITATLASNALVRVFVDGALQFTREFGTSLLPLYTAVLNASGFGKMLTVDNAGGAQSDLFVHEWYGRGGPEDRDGRPIT